MFGEVSHSQAERYDYVCTCRIRRKKGKELGIVYIILAITTNLE